MRSRKQMYKCKDCNRQFLGGRRRDKTQVITDYVEGKQTIEQLSVRYGVSSRTIQRDLKGMRYVQKISKNKDVTIQLDTTYWGRNFGLMVIKDAYQNKILWFKFVKNETVSDYAEEVQWLKINGFKIYGIVCDGKRGLFREFRCYRVQMCLFHLASYLPMGAEMVKPPSLKPCRTSLTHFASPTHIMARNMQ